VTDLPFWELTLSGLAVSLPGIIVTVWISNRNLKSHLSKVTGEQTTAIRGMTNAQTTTVKADLNAQTSVLLSRRRAKAWKWLHWPWA
jgi:hypothetical protein